MRGPTDAAKVRELMRRLGAEARGPGRIYLVGGTSAVLLGWRAATVDVDVKLDPEPPGVFRDVLCVRKRYSSARRRRSAFPMTDSELSVIATLAQMGLISRPTTG